ncbi:Uncharacterized protein FWK35_00035282, partial [Aphis craccivora]
VVPRRLPPLRNAGLIARVPSGSSYEETVAKLQQSGVNPDDFGATIGGIRKSQKGDVVVDLGRSAKSRAAAIPFKNALSEKVPGVSATVAPSGSNVEMEVVDLEPTSTSEAVLAAVKNAIISANKEDAAVVALVGEITVTSMWRLKNGQQVAKISVPRAAKPTESGAISAMASATRKLRALGQTSATPVESAGRGRTRKRNVQGMPNVLPAIGRASRPAPTVRAQLHARPDVLQSCGASQITGMINFLQVNLNGSWAAQQLLDQTVLQRDIDILILSEPYARTADRLRLRFSLDRKAAVGTSPGTAFVHDDGGSGQGYAWIRLRDLVVFSCYWRPGTTLGELVVGGDFNAWNVEWGSRCNNPRGELLADLVASLGLTLANTGDTPTFVRGEATSVIDVTFSRGAEIHGWTVLDEINLSDHAYVTFSIDSPPVDPHPGWPQAAAAGRGHPGWALKKFNIEAFYNHVNARRLSLPRSRFGTNEALHAAEELDKYIADACDASMPLRTPCPRGRKPVYWWNDHIAELRVKTLSLRRAYQSALRRLGSYGAATARAVFSMARKDLRREIRRAKEQSWKGLCNQVESDPWGRPYKLIMRKFGDESIRLASKGRELAISDHLFPEAPVINWDLMPRPETRNIFEPFDPNSDDLVFDTIIPEFRVDELLKATKKMSSGKAGGPSGIPNEILKRVIHARPSSTLDVYNKCLTSLTFPACWKKASLVLLHKGQGKPVEAPSSFRPICLLDTPGKVLERLLLQRLDEHLDSRYAGRAPNQFGFRRGISTESAVEVVTKLAKFAAKGNRRQVELCVLVTLDVKNAFNSLRWPVIDEALREKDTPEYLVRMIRSWLSDRELLVGENRAPKAVTCGVPQGSVLGPTLWNIVYDDLLTMDVPPGIQMIGFADDLAVVGLARTGEQLEDLVNPVLDRIDGWMVGHGLQLAHQKTEAHWRSADQPKESPSVLRSHPGHPSLLWEARRNGRQKSGHFGGCYWQDHAQHQRAWSMEEKTLGIRSRVPAALRRPCVGGFRLRHC